MQITSHKIQRAAGLAAQHLSGKIEARELRSSLIALISMLDDEATRQLASILTSQSEGK